MNFYDNTYWALYLFCPFIQQLWRFLPEKAENQLYTTQESVISIKTLFALNC